MTDPFRKARNTYKNTPIPKELDRLVDQALQTSPRKRRWPQRSLVGIAAAAAIFAGTVNMSPTVAEAMAKWPVIGDVVKTITFAEVEMEEKKASFQATSPDIQGGDSALAAQLNEQYIEENKQLYNEFMSELDTLEKNETAHLAVDSGYNIVTDTPQILSIHRYVVEMRGSSAQTNQYDTIDKENEMLITLPSLFTDHSYIEAISESIKQQMKAQMAADENKTYWLEDDDMTEPFQQIDDDHTFYITESHQLVIVFDDYEVAPGYMGSVEFTIPTEAIDHLLVSNAYIR
ncbi:DUF3298 domain-containing protein [Bacillaceae bacterium SIJ1]|uniref:RsiV family protein n=1 Tax=Litoribacterium kuwaitense TaxID=1398745 RepID=UPI0013EBDB99|nr:RsiV family protein [Litoribacterium kuwaitense]NGP45933.1 DUF3298 domain-containing protein [Litoribacterium kuwaitense]